jgi:hypothetical protein
MSLERLNKPPGLLDPESKEKTTVVARIEHWVERQRVGEDFKVNLTPNCGLAEFKPDKTLDDLTRPADEALFRG